MAGERYLLDMHVWLWLVEDDRTSLKASQIQQLLRWRKENRLYLPAISFWEVSNALSLGRVQLSLALDAWLALTTNDPYLTIIPLSTDVLVESTRLPGVIHRDPADRMIVAAARQHGLTLLTRDAKLISYAGDGHLRVHKV